MQSCREVESLFNKGEHLYSYAIFSMLQNKADLKTIIDGMFLDASVE